MGPPHLTQTCLCTPCGFFFPGLSGLASTGALCCSSHNVEHGSSGVVRLLITPQLSACLHTRIRGVIEAVSAHPVAGTGMLLITRHAAQHTFSDASLPCSYTGDMRRLQPQGHPLIVDMIRTSCTLPQQLCLSRSTSASPLQPTLKDVPVCNCRMSRMQLQLQPWISTLQKRKVYACRRGLWEALNRSMASRPQKEV